MSELTMRERRIELDPELDWAERVLKRELDY
jgi:hypothetical protein